MKYKMPISPGITVQSWSNLFLTRAPVPTEPTEPVNSSIRFVGQMCHLGCF